MSQLSQVNYSIHHQEVSQDTDGSKETTGVCNCSGIIQEIRKMFDTDEKKLESVRAELEQLKQKSVEEDSECKSSFFISKFHNHAQNMQAWHQSKA